MLGLRLAQRGLDRRQVHAVYGAHDMPAVGAETGAHVLKECDVRVALYRDTVVVVEVDDLAELVRAANDAASDATPSMRSPSEQIP